MEVCFLGVRLGLRSGLREGSRRAHSEERVGELLDRHIIPSGLQLTCNVIRRGVVARGACDPGAAVRVGDLLECALMFYDAFDAHGVSQRCGIRWCWYRHSCSSNDAESYQQREHKSKN